MKRLLALFSAICLLAWTLPLGAFIKPSQEKMACGGNRAFHMCSMMSGEGASKPKAIDSVDNKVSLSDASGAARTARASAVGGGIDWLLAESQNLPALDENIFSPDYTTLRLNRVRFCTSPPPELSLHR